MPGKHIEVVMVSCPLITQIYIKRAVTERNGIYPTFVDLLFHFHAPHFRQRAAAKGQEACTIYKGLLPHYSQEVDCLIFD